MSRITELLFSIKEEVDRISEKRSSGESQELLNSVLMTSIRKTLEEIKNGADGDDFQSLVVINFVIAADDENIDVDTIKGFVDELTLSDDEPTVS